MCGKGRAGGRRSCNCAGRSVTRSVDRASSNRTQQDRVGLTDPGTTTYSYDDADQLTNTTLANAVGTSSNSYTYDAQGHLTTGGRTWDLVGHMTASDVNGAATYRYDGLGNRIAITTASGSTTSTALEWDLNNSLPMLTGANSSRERAEARFTSTNHSSMPDAPRVPEQPGWRGAEDGSVAPESDGLGPHLLPTNRMISRELE